MRKLDLCGKAMNSPLLCQNTDAQHLRAAASCRQFLRQIELNLASKAALAIRIQQHAKKKHSADFKAKAAPEATREDMTMAELAKKYGVYPTHIGTWKRAATTKKWPRRFPSEKMTLLVPA